MIAGRTKTFVPQKAGFVFVGRALQEGAIANNPRGIGRGDFSHLSSEPICYFKTMAVKGQT
jgi:hypothetical protein